MGRMTTTKTEQLKSLAKTIYLAENAISHKELADKVGVDAKTISRWISEEKWDTIRKSLLTTKAKQLAYLYDQLEALNQDIKTREIKYATNKESDTLIKLTTAIKNLETETSIADIVQVAKGFISHIKEYNQEKAKELTQLFDAYIQHKIK